MNDLGPPVAYLALHDGVPVYDRDRVHVGEVEHVLADEGSDIFHGLSSVPPTRTATGSSIGNRRARCTRTASY
jgi:hypothetical protein